MVIETTIRGSPTRVGGSLQYDLELLGDADSPGWLRLGLGLRAAGPLGGASVPLEVYLLPQLAATIGPWYPAVGPELGLTGLLRPEPRIGSSQVLGEGQEGEGHYEQLEDVGPVYLAISAAPLRFAIADFRLSALSVGAGTSLAPPGQVLRFQLGIVQVGWLP